jgi:hypothetical protein
MVVSFSLECGVAAAVVFYGTPWTPPGGGTKRLIQAS